MSLSQTIWQAANQARASEGFTVNLSAIARKLSMRISTLWGYHHGKVAWPADVWLASMLLTGAAEWGEDAISIKLPQACGPAYSRQDDTLRKLLAHELGDRIA